MNNNKKGNKIKNKRKKEIKMNKNIKQLLNKPIFYIKI